MVWRASWEEMKDGDGKSGAVGFRWGYGSGGGGGGSGLWRCYRESACLRGGLGIGWVMVLENHRSQLAQPSCGIWYFIFWKPARVVTKGDACISKPGS